MQNYKFYEKLLHELILSNENLKKSMFLLEKYFISKKIFNWSENKHIFITGLPRSGSTALLNFFYKTEKFASLTYKDMPFVLAVNLFKFVNESKSIEVFKERAHKDGIFYSKSSPEAFEEIFWNTFKEKTDTHYFITYLNLILNKYNKSRYLSKNNYNYKRIDFIKKKFPNSLLIILFRDPLQTSYSLLKQHQRFIQLQKKNNFIKKYMIWLGHTEFGESHKYWFKPNTYKDTKSINYWLEQWLLFYKNLLALNLQNYKNLLFLEYEKLSQLKTMKKLSNKAMINYQHNENPFILSVRNELKGFNPDLLNECQKVLKKLKDSK